MFYSMSSGHTPSFVPPIAGAGATTATRTAASVAKTARAFSGPVTDMVRGADGVWTAAGTEGAGTSLVTTEAAGTALATTEAVGEGALVAGGLGSAGAEAATGIGIPLAVLTVVGVGGYELWHHRDQIGHFFQNHFGNNRTAPATHASATSSSASPPVGQSKAPVNKGATPQSSVKHKAHTKAAAISNIAAPTVGDDGQGEVHFATSSDQLNEQGRDAVKQMATKIKASGATHITIEGHTDMVGSQAYDLDLSKRRAEAVAAELRTNGVTIDIETKGMGKKGLEVSTGDQIANDANRRAEIVLDKKPAAPSPTPPAESAIPRTSMGRGGRAPSLRLENADGIISPDTNPSLINNGPGSPLPSPVQNDNLTLVSNPTTQGNSGANQSAVRRPRLNTLTV